jgi:adenylate cyclase
MQMGTVIHNQQNPNLPLHLKIGLNAGEPIAEDGDLFGTMVQLSARIVDKASADQIYVSEIVRGLCAGKDYSFVSRGGFEMKGFSDETVLYEVMWNGSGGEGEVSEESPDLTPSQEAATPQQPVQEQAAPAQPAPAPPAEAPDDAGTGESPPAPPEKNTP